MSGVISGDGGFKKVGDGTTSFSVITPIPVLLRLKREPEGHRFTQRRHGCLCR